LQWSEKAAEQGFDKAYGVLGYCYYNGKGTLSDGKQAVKWLKKAIENKNDIESFYYLARCYNDGNGILKNEAKAVEYFTYAAEKWSCKCTI
jgi:TPR repeat protein